MKFPKNIIVIEVNSIEFTGKDIIEIKGFEDFCWLINGCIFKLKDAYYIIGETFAYIYRK